MIDDANGSSKRPTHDAHKARVDRFVTAGSAAPGQLLGRGAKRDKETERQLANLRRQHTPEVCELVEAAARVQALADAYNGAEAGILTPGATVGAEATDSERCGRTEVLPGNLTARANLELAARKVRKQMDAILDSAAHGWCEIPVDKPGRESLN